MTKKATRETKTADDTEGTLDDAGMQENPLTLFRKMGAAMLLEDDVDNGEDLAQSIGGDWQTVVGGAGGYWPSFKGSAIHGIVENRFSAETEYGEAQLVTLRVLHPAPAIDANNEPYVARPGALVAVLCRSLLRATEDRKGLSDLMGQEVLIVCLGKGRNRADTQDLWRYEVRVRAQVEEKPVQKSA